MSYAGNESSQQDSSPIMLYEFTRSGTTWRYCALKRNVTALTYTWTAEDITSDKINRSGDVPKDTVQVSLPVTNAMAVAFLDFALPELTELSIYRTHATELTTGLMIWAGRVTRYTVTKGVITLDCESMLRSLKRLGARPRWSRMCRYGLFQPGCNLVKATYAQEVTATAAAGVVITIPGLSILGDFAGGSLEYGGITRTIIRHRTTLVTLRAPIQALSDAIAEDGSADVNVYLGCNLSYDQCNSRWNNKGNWGGFFIPGSNPMDGQPIVNRSR